MRYFVTGGTGFLGSHLIRQLIANGDEVVALVYEDDREPVVRSWGAETVVGGFEHGLLTAAMSGCDGVFHVAGYVSLDDPKGTRSTAINVDGVRVVGNASVDAGVRRFVHTSSLVTIGCTREGRTLDEESPFECGGLSLPYIETKREGEAIAFSLQDRGLEVVVCNPAGIIGPDDYWGSEANAVFDLYRANGVPVVPQVRNNWADVRDIAAGEIAAMHDGRSGQRYFLGADNTTLKNLLGHLDEALDRPRRRRFEFGWP